MKQNTPGENDPIVDELAELESVRPRVSRRVVPMVPRMHSYQFKILSLLQSKPIYQGTVAERTGSAGRAKRRAAGKAQKAARRANRR